MIINYKDILETPSSSLREGVTNFFRNAIRSGQLRSGDSIPSSRELAKLLNTSFPNVHYGLTTLVKEGLISRDRKTGTIVNHREPRMKCIVIYTSVTTLDDLGSFQHSLIDIIYRRLNTLGIKYRLVIDNETHYGLSQIKEWEKRGEIQGVIMPRQYDDETIRSVMRNLSIPVTFPGKTNSVKIDMTRLLELAIKGLKKQGCVTVGIISTIEHFDKNGKENKFYADFKKKAIKSGLEWKNEWIEAVDSKENYLRSSEMAMNYAFSACDRILRLPNRPDGLFVFSDNLIAGTLLAIMKSDINIPNDIKLVLHLNHEIAIPLFKPCVVVGLSITELANALINETQAQFKGEKTKTTIVRYESKDFLWEPIAKV